MQRHSLNLVLLPGPYAVSRLSADAVVPDWAQGEFVSISRSLDELSIVCRADAVPAGVRCESGWRAWRIAGTLDFSLVGILASLLLPLAEAGVSVFTVSTFDTDYLLVKEHDLPRAASVLMEAGHRAQRQGVS